MSVTVYLTPTGKPAGIPPCCTCDRAVCAADTTGEHCEARGCGTCLHGCPAPAGKPCCLDGGESR
ncbi:hypothetical protein [Micromonospora sediminicola]|uniref:hypothetical protein n=1 Tax=Micromonospora sediminicola TaxID=946078 RepID=UPI0037B109E9